MDEDYYDETEYFVVGTEGPDVIYAFQDGDGAGGDDYINGASVHGGDGSDEVDGVESGSGGSGNDLIRHAHYTMEGGPGRDVFFRFERFYDTGKDDRGLVPAGQILDFNPAEDKIASSALLHFTSEFTGVAGQMIYDEEWEQPRTLIDLDGDGDWEVSISGKVDPSHYIPIVIDGTDENDIASGDGLLVGGAGHDILSGRQGDDFVFGGFGNDILSGGRGNDLLVGNAGADRLNGGMDDDELDGGDGNDILSGGWGNDIAYGGAGDDVISGGAGRDVLSGGSGSDRLNGGDGDDILDGGAGADFLIGGTGKDRFVFRPGDSGVTVGARDWISDFESGVDIIDLTAFTDAAVTIERGERHFLLSIDEGGDGSIDAIIAVEVTGAYPLSMADLLL